MKKNSVIGILILLFAFAMTYAKIKANEAEQQRIMAEIAEEKASQFEQLAKEQEQLAIQAAAQARMAEADALEQKAAAEKALLDCQSK